MDTPSLVHYLPIATTLVSATFLVVLLRRASQRSWAPHLTWWAIGVFFYGLGTTVESTITLTGNTVLLNRLWYWAGAILGGYPLATGSLYLLAKRGLAHTLTAISLVVVIVASVAVLLTPINAEAIDPVRPSGSVLEWRWVRLMTPFINLYSLLFLVGGAIWSSYKFVRVLRRSRRACPMCGYDLHGLPDATVCPECGSSCAPGAYQLHRLKLKRRAIGTALIAVGGLLPGIGGGLTKTHDLPEALYIGELTGIILIWIGYELCTRRFASDDRVVAGASEPEPSPA